MIQIIEEEMEDAQLDQLIKTAQMIIDKEAAQATQPTQICQFCDKIGHDMTDCFALEQVAEDAYQTKIDAGRTDNDSDDFKYQEYEQSKQ